MKKQRASRPPSFLLDLNISPKTAEFLESLGFDAKRLNYFDMKSATDDKVIELAKEQKRIVITFDKDFGEIYYFHEKGNVGIIILRIEDQRQENVNKTLKEFLSSVDIESLKNTLVILYENRYRILHYDKTD